MKHTTKQIIFGVIALMALFWLWPNFIHEPMHLLALKAQGIDGTIHFSSSFPAHPYTVRAGQIQSIAGGLLFLLAPSILSIVLLMVIWITRKTPTVLTHIVLPAYLGTDLMVNLSGYATPTNDFHFLVVFDAVIPKLLIGAVAILFVITIHLNLHYLVQSNNVSSEVTQSQALQQKV